MRKYRNRIDYIDKDNIIKILIIITIILAIFLAGAHFEKWENSKRNNIICKVKERYT